jgi:hypothetical protein
MFASFFGSRKQPPAVNAEQPNVLLTTLSITEITSAILKLGQNDMIKTFFALTNEQQIHVFPLLPDTPRDAVFTLATEDQQEEFLEQCAAFRESSQVDITHSDSFFYCMKVWNALKFTDTLKTSYVLSADKVLPFDLKPYKYQRQLLERHVQTIANGIEQSKIMFHPIILGYNGHKNSLTILDGQHRYQALKRLSPNSLQTLMVQLDVIFFPDNDSEIMTFYKNINTNVPIDPAKLQDELKYVALLEKIKAEFKDNIKVFVKDDKDKTPQHIVIDTWLKEELQYREILNTYTEDQVLARLHDINETIAKSPSTNLSMIERRMCVRNNFYLGVKWPAAIDLL